MDYLKNKRILENNLSNTNNIDIFIEEFHSILAAVFDLLGEEAYIKLYEGRFPFRNAGNVLKNINAYQDALIDVRDNNNKLFQSNNLIRSLTNCSECRKLAKVAFKEIEESIKNSDNEQEENALRKIHTNLRRACNELLRAVIEMCQRRNIDISNFELDYF